MSTSAISSISHALATKPQSVSAPLQKRPADGDTPAVEAAENASTQAAEKRNGGFLNKLV